jgi:cytochrome c553
MWAMKLVWRAARIPCILLLLTCWQAPILGMALCRAAEPQGQPLAALQSPQAPLPPVTPVAAGKPAQVPDTMAQRLKACTACHGPLGRAGPDGYYPRIAGKPAGYLYNQLVAFRDGARQYPPMRSLLTGMPAAYLREIAAFFASQHPGYAPPSISTAPPATLARGRVLALDGDPDQKLPACQACHGAILLGVEPAIPALIGLPRDYLNGQLGAWRNGRRSARAPDCMAEVVRHLSDADANAVSAWLAATPVPAGALPAVQTEQKLPLECGSLAREGSP